MNGFSFFGRAALNRNDEIKIRSFPSFSARPGSIQGYREEIVTESMWGSFENLMQRISEDPEACWGNIVDLFGDRSHK